ncbi:ATP-binding cassette domain-containing protein [Klebsiella pneumoniae subsp. pneumoniae]|nr:ATP-binding cassette domain-containing protein [Klebsiella pneumoniae subsp. pneumoniae]
MATTPFLTSWICIFPSGQFVAVVGRSGGGKSTLLRLLAGLEKPNAGELPAGATPPGGNPGRHPDDVSGCAPAAVGKTVIDNVGLGLKAPGATPPCRRWPVGLESRAQEWPAALSGGQKQRVALARALIHRPRLLLLDEPLGALDALTRLEMQELIVSLWQEHGFTVLLVTHDVSEAVAMADRVLLIEEKKIGLDLSVDIPRPRRTGPAKPAELEAEVLDRVMKRGDSERAPRLFEVMADRRYCPLSERGHIVIRHVPGSRRCTAGLPTPNQPCIPGRVSIAPPEQHHYVNG